MSPKSNRRMRRRTGCTGIAAKNTLVAEDAHLVEASFSNRLATIKSSVSETLSAQRGHPSEAIAASAASLKEERRLTHRRLIPRKLRLSYSGLRLLVAAKSSPRRSACATRNTASLSRPSRASSVAACRVKRTIYVSPNRARWAARSATSTWSQSVAFITASCIVTAMRPHGGPGSTSTRFRSPSSFGDARVPQARTPSLS